MQHTYLRYECADAFSLTTSASITSQPTTCPLLILEQQTILLSTSCSQLIGFHLRTKEPCVKIGYTQLQNGNIGTGQALNSNEVLCIASSSTRVASGWNDGSIRVYNNVDFDTNQTTHSLLLNEEDTYKNNNTCEPLVLNGHYNTPVTCLAFDHSTHLASGSSNGTILLWDIVAETGLFRLLGHSNRISDLQFISTDSNIIISSSHDGTVKVWNVLEQCCIQTMVHPVTCCTRIMSNDRERLLTGGSDGKVRLYSIDNNNNSDQLVSTTPPTTITTTTDVTDSDLVIKDDSNKTDICQYMGDLLIPLNSTVSNEKIISIHSYQKNQKFFIGITRMNSKELELYQFRTKDETLRKQKRRLRRKQQQKQKAAKSETKKRKTGLLDDDDDIVEEESAIKATSTTDIKASDEFEYVTTVRCSQRIKAFTFLDAKKKRMKKNTEAEEVVQVVTALASNALEMHSIMCSQEDDKQYTSVLVSSLGQYGHPTGIRSIDCSSDDTLACTVSKNVLKIWNIANRSCTQSLLLDSNTKKNKKRYALCCTFLPGTQHVLIGTKEGSLLIVDIGSGDIVFTNETAHDGAIWSLDLHLTTTDDDTTLSIMTGSTDKTVKFWDVEDQDDDDEEEEEEDFTTTGQPMLVHVRTLATKDEIMAVQYSYSGNMIFVATLDCQINVYMADTLKFFLSLYGHSLPALAFDASDDDAILASGGADKTIKIWGLDFGDTHRTLYGHTDSITDLRFVKKTHYFFTSSKDATVRYWDGDRFEQILLLSGHMAEINSLAVANSGAFVLSAGKDRQIRVWERTKDMVFLEEEKEYAMESMFERVDNKGDEIGTAQVMMRHRRQGEEEEEEGNNNVDQPQSEAAVKRSVLSVSAGDRIMEALERADQEIKDTAIFKRSQHGKGDNAKKRTPNPIMLGMEPSQYILWVLRSVKSSELEQSLLVLPLSHMERLLFYIISLLRSGKGVEICARASIFLIKTHQYQVIGNKSMAILLRELKRLLKIRLVEARDTIGYNLAAIRIISKITKDHKKRFRIPSENDEVTDVWAGLGLGK